MKAKLQKIYNTVFKGLASQGFVRSMEILDDDLEYCLYRDGKGCRCAGGWLIPDNKYDADFEGQAANGIGYFITKYNSDEMALILHLQGVHDTCVTPDLMKERLIEAASLFDLEVPTV